MDIPQTPEPTPQQTRDPSHSHEPIAQTHEPTLKKPRKPLRLWPGVVAAALLGLGRFVVPIVAPEATLYGLLGAALGILGVVVWWLFFSRARWFERLGAVVLMVGALFATFRIVHVSIANGAMGNLFYVLAVPVLCLALVAWAAATRRLSDRLRRASLLVTILLACAAFTLIRTGGLTADFDQDLHFRWTRTPEELLLAQAGDEPTVLPSAPAAAKTGADWPGFRGPERDGVVRGVRIETDWSKSPPLELWRRPIGPGW